MVGKKCNEEMQGREERARKLYNPFGRMMNFDSSFLWREGVKER